MPGRILNEVDQAAHGQHEVHATGRYGRIGGAGPDVTRRCLAGNLGENRAYQVVGRHDLQLDGHRVAIEAGEVEQVGHEAVQPIRLRLDDRRPLLAAAHLLGYGLDGGERRAHVVRHGRQKGVLQSVGFPQGTRSLLLRHQADALHAQGRVVR